MLFNLLSVVSFIGVVYFYVCFHHGGKFVGRVDKVEVGKDVYTFPKLRDMPDSGDIDKEYGLLRDVIDTCRSEQWRYEVKRESYSISKVFSVNIFGPDNFIRISSRVRINDDDDLTLVGFHVMGKEGSISYDMRGVIKFLCLDLIWNYCILPENSKEYNIEMERLGGICKSISDGLVSLNRDRKLGKLLNDV